MCLIPNVRDSSFPPLEHIHECGQIKALIFVVLEVANELPLFRDHLLVRLIDRVVEMTSLDHPMEWSDEYRQLQRL